MFNSKKNKKNALTRQTEKITHLAAEKLSTEVEKIVYKVMTNQGLEDTISNAVQKGLITLILRYWLLIAFGLVAFLIAHTVIVTLVVTTYLNID